MLVGESFGRNVRHTLTQFYFNGINADSFDNNSLKKGGIKCFEAVRKESYF